MDSVERVLKLCEERKVRVSRLEKDLGFGNGYIKSLRRGKIPVDRAAKIAEYFNVPIEIFTEEKEKAPPVGGEREATDEIIQAAFWGGYKDLSQEEIDAMWDEVKAYAAFKAEEARRKKKK